MYFSDKHNAIIMSESDFTTNVADRGGAVYVTATNTQVMMTKCSFIENRLHNKAGALGGAVYITGNGNLLSTNKGTFVRNTAGLGGGGAIYSRGQYTNFSLVQTTFSYNSAASCGVIDVDDFNHESVNFTRSTFIHNRATGE